MSRILIAAGLVLTLTGCSIPLASDDPQPAVRPTISAWDEIQAGDEIEVDDQGGALDAEAFDPTCLDVPEPLVEWLDEHSWEYSKTRPAGEGQMIAAGGGWYIAAVPTTGEFDAKAWAWVPGANDAVARIMPLPADWDDIDPDDEDHPAQYYKARLPIEDGAHAAAMECLGA